MYEIWTWMVQNFVFKSWFTIEETLKMVFNEKIRFLWHLTPAGPCSKVFTLIISLILIIIFYLLRQAILRIFRSKNNLKKTSFIKFMFSTVKNSRSISRPVLLFREILWIFPKNAKLIHFPIWQYTFLCFILISGT